MDVLDRRSHSHKVSPSVAIALEDVFKKARAGFHKPQIDEEAKLRRTLPGVADSNVCDLDDIVQHQKVMEESLIGVIMGCDTMNQELEKLEDHRTCLCDLVARFDQAERTRSEQAQIILGMEEKFDASNYGLRPDRHDNLVASIEFCQKTMAMQEQLLEKLSVQCEALGARLEASAASWDRSDTCGDLVARMEQNEKAMLGQAQINETFAVSFDSSAARLDTCDDLLARIERLEEAMSVQARSIEEPSWHNDLFSRMEQTEKEMSVQVRSIEALFLRLDMSASRLNACDALAERIEQIEEATLAQARSIEESRMHLDKPDENLDKYGISDIAARIAQSETAMSGQSQRIDNLLAKLASSAARQDESDDRAALAEESERSVAALAQVIESLSLRLDMLGHEVRSARKEQETELAMLRGEWLAKSVGVQQLPHHGETNEARVARQVAKQVVLSVGESSQDPKETLLAAVGINLHDVDRLPLQPKQVPQSVLGCLVTNALGDSLATAREESRDMQVRTNL